MAKEEACMQKANLGPDRGERTKSSSALGSEIKFTGVQGTWEHIKARYEARMMI